MHKHVINALKILEAIGMPKAHLKIAVFHSRVRFLMSHARLPESARIGVKSMRPGIKAIRRSKNIT